MTSTPGPRSVVVLGGGVLGVSTAAHLRRAGADVVLVTEDELASGASGRSLSWLNSAGARSDAYHLLRSVGIDRYRTLFAADPSREWLRFDGGLWWTTPDDEDAPRERHATEVAHGYDSRLVTREEPPVPGVEPGDAGHLAVHNPGEGWVSLPHLVEHLAAELTAAGGRVVIGAGRCSVLVEDGRARGVRTAAGDVHRADAVVVACGAGTPAVLAALGVDLPDASPLSALVVTEPVDSDARVVLNTPRAALRPHPGGRFAVDHDWYEQRIVEGPDGCTVDEEVVGELLGEASALLAGRPALRAASWRAGRKPVPADGEPVLGELDEVPGCHVAFTHSGATLGLIAGELLAHQVLTGTVHPLLEPFQPGRFRR
ncbi:NAD(P)/FAD-dependent oxidoreductase [Kineococcus sp. SYSU DK004]|uniref:NAD(P)/FAD-dependent oxidoreductase n=1 Tax=Kineococcus sp. SYSU DK004 TaxID=3383125 RepID=UPI003D7EB95C